MEFRYLGLDDPQGSGEADTRGTVATTREKIGRHGTGISYRYGGHGRNGDHNAVFVIGGALWVWMEANGPRERCKTERGPS